MGIWFIESPSFCVFHFGDYYPMIRVTWLRILAFIFMCSHYLQQSLRLMDMCNWWWLLVESWSTYLDKSWKFDSESSFLWVLHFGDYFPMTSVTWLRILAFIMFIQYPQQSLIVMDKCDSGGDLWPNHSGKSWKFD